MSMKLSTRQVDGVTIVDCSGRITLGEGSVTLRDTVRDLLSKGNKKIILNLAEVNYIDSSGIGELVSAFTTTKEPGRRTEIAAPYQKGSRPATDHQALHRFRRQRRRSRSGQGIQITLLARHRWFGNGHGFSRATQCLFELRVVRGASADCRRAVSFRETTRFFLAAFPACSNFTRRIVTCECRSHRMQGWPSVRRGPSRLAAIPVDKTRLSVSRCWLS